MQIKVGWYRVSKLSSLGMRAFFVANKYFDTRKPWIQVKDQPSECCSTLHTCIQIIANLANLLTPFLPFSCDELQKLLRLRSPDLRWGYVELAPGHRLDKPTTLFSRIEVSRIQEEVERLHDQRVE